MGSQEADEVSVEYLVDVGLGVASILQETFQAREVRDGVQILRGLFSSKSSIEIGANPHVIGIPGQLADVIGMIEHVIEYDAGPFRSAQPPVPPGHQHPRIKRGPDHRTTFNEALDLLIRKLPRVINEGATV